MPKRTTGKMQLVDKEAYPAGKGDYGKFWSLYNNRDLIVFTVGQSKYDDQLAACFPHMRRENAIAYCNTLASLVKT
jgi:hypothetical protein